MSVIVFHQKFQLAHFLCGWKSRNGRFMEQTKHVKNLKSEIQMARKLLFPQIWVYGLHYETVRTLKRISYKFRYISAIPPSSTTMGKTLHI